MSDRVVNPRLKHFLVLPGIVAAVVFVRLAADVRFMDYCFAMPFLAGSDFYRRFSGYVGGPVQYVANLFSQSYHRPWAGALALAVLALVSWTVAQGILRRFRCKACGVTAALFPMLMLIVVSRYVAVVYAMPMIAGLAASWLYMALRPAEPCRVLFAGRTIPWSNSNVQGALLFLFMAASVPLYYLLASGFLYFCALCALFEVLVAKRRVFGILWLGCALLVPYGVSRFLYEPDVIERYFRWIAVPEYHPLTTALLTAFYAFVPLAALASFFIDRFGLADRFSGLSGKPAKAVLGVALASLAAGMFIQRLGRSDWVYADFLIADGQFEKALDCLRKQQDDSDPVRFLTFRALARSGRLPWDMFRYPQRHSSDALLLRDAKWDSFPRVANWRSDLYLDLGRVNESQRWAHESLAVEGETPRVLERLALVYILNANPDAGKTFLRALHRVPFQAQRAEAYLSRLQADSSLSGDALVRQVRPLMLRSDYVGNWSTDQIFRQCLEVNPANRTAFEYLLAHYLLNCDMKGFGTLAARFKDFYAVLPTHVEEALLVYRHVNGSWPAGIEESMVRPEAESRFVVFLERLAQHQNGFEETWNAMAPEFGETYWFFDAFGRTAAGPPAGARQSGDGASAAGLQGGYRP